MEYIGLHTQIARNNRRSVLLLMCFPTLILLAVYAVMFFVGEGEFAAVNELFLTTFPLVLIGVGVWFLIAFLSHTAIIKATSSSFAGRQTRNPLVQYG